MKNALILALMVLTQVFGDLWLSQGMKKFGEVQALDLHVIEALLVYVLTSPWILLGVATLISSLLFYLVAVSRFDLSYVLPIHASGYVFNALFAWLILGEQVSLLRWIATVFVSVGVFLITWANRAEPVQADSSASLESRRPMLGLLFAVSLTSAMARVWMGVWVLVAADAAGDLFLAKGMKQIGSVPLKTPQQLFEFVRRVLTSADVLRGICCQAIAFFTFLCLLSWADISYVRPATALTYAASLLGARFTLKERVVPGRFFGMAAIGIGVALVAFT